MRYAIAGLSMLLGLATVAAPATAQVSVSVSIPGVSIGIHQPSYPELVLVPGSPVYYAPHVPANYFFYDGLYWVFQDDNWYVSSWYNGPWDLVEPDDVPLFVLRVPVQYYVRPPVFFHTWIVTAPPRWHFHWGPRWTRYHHGWDHWDRHAIPAPAPLPVYQRYYHGDRYPRREYQRVIRHEHYQYRSRDQVVRRHDQQRAAPRPQMNAQPHNRPAPHQYSPDSSRQEQRPQRDREEAQRSQRTREDRQRSEPRQIMTQQQPQQHATPAQASVQPARARPDVPRVQPQREQRERGESRKPEGMYVLPQQRAAVLQERQQERQQQQQRQQAPRAQQAPRPQQAQGQQGRERGGAEQRQGSRQDRGQERGRDRGQGRG